MRVKNCVLIVLIIFVANTMNIANADTRKIPSPFKNKVTKSKKTRQVTPMSAKQTAQEKKYKYTEAEEGINPMVDKNNPLGLLRIEDKIKRAIYLVKIKRYTDAEKEFKAQVEWLIDATEYHTSLFKVLRNVDNADAQAGLERELALQHAVLRDIALFEYANLKAIKKDYKKAVELLVDVVRSQPKTELGFRAYEKLQRIGFTFKVKPQLEDAAYEEQSAEDTNQVYKIGQ